MDSDAKGAPGLSTASEDAIERRLDVQPDQERVGSLKDAFQVEWTIEKIQQKGYSKIALQFPDELLHVSVPIYRALRAALPSEREVYVMADTTYGSCCVDEITAQHVDADVVVHYGHACMSPTSRLPVIYVLGHKPIDVSHAASSLIDASELRNKAPKEVELVIDVAYSYQTDALTEQLKNLLGSETMIRLQRTPTFAEPEGKAVKTPELQAAGPEDAVLSNATKLHENVSGGEALVYWIGTESMTLTNLLMTHSTSEIWSYDPTTRAARLESHKTNKLLMRRYAVMHKARDADVFAILIGTLGVAQYTSLIKSLRALLSRHRKKTYVINVGKLNPSKLANFSEVECFVLVACRESSVVESKEFLRPIVTPFELVMALEGGKDWTGRYLLDFDQVLPEMAREGAAVVDPDSDVDGPRFSLISGRYRYVKQYGKGETAAGDQLVQEAGALTVRNNDGTVARFMDSAGGEFLQNRTFQGLEARLGQDEPGALEMGRSGIARGYGEAGVS